MDVLGYPHKGVAVTLGGHRGGHRRESVTSQIADFVRFSYRRRSVTLPRRSG
jgi:hypothetical protein